MRGRKCHYTAVLICMQTTVWSYYSMNRIRCLPETVTNDLPTILEVLAPHHAEIKGLVVESTYTGTGSLMG